MLQKRKILWRARIKKRLYAIFLALDNPRLFRIKLHFLSLISFSFFCSFLVYFFCLPYLLAYLNGHPSCAGWGGGGGVYAFAIFIFSAQFKSGTDQSDKPKTPKFISKSLFTTLV